MKLGTNVGERMTSGTCRMKVVEQIDWRYGEKNTGINDRLELANIRTSYLTHCESHRSLQS